MSSSTVSDRLRPASDRLPESFSFRILSVDGGGIRGVIPALLLERLEALLAAALAAAPTESAARWRGIDSPRIADCFHLIAGTSTGGLLAAGLTSTGPDGRPTLTAGDAANVYTTHGPAIFHSSVIEKVEQGFGLTAPKYPLAQLRTALEDPAVLGDARLKDARTGVLILSFDTTIPGLRYFTRWGQPGAGSTPTTPAETMVEVALATAAAPTYFDPEALGRSRLIDGGVYAGNPALAAITLALRRTTEPIPRTPRELFMVSLGTGAWSAPLDYGGGGIIGWLQPRTGGEALLKAMLGGSSDFANEAAHMLLNGDAPVQDTWEPALPPAHVGGGPQLWRYQPALPEPFAMDDVSKLPQLKQIAAQLADRYADELAGLATRLIDAGPVP
ncbi:MAG: patatin-like phospholipase family protein [Actinomycetota bacterium]|nr:patatin-like phospholipase family protein [Actinomycetota bacterium]